MIEKKNEMYLCKKCGKYHRKRYPLNHFTKKTKEALKLFISQKKKLIKELHFESGYSISRICNYLEDKFNETLFYEKKPYIHIIPEISKFILCNILDYKNWDDYNAMLSKLRSKLNSRERYKAGFTDKLKKEIKERDNNKCRVCTQKKKPLHVHHFDGNRFNNDPENLITLCVGCHKESKNYSKKELKAILSLR
ncbi:MAG: hypothetical protein V3V33_16730 [Candidatus Lokiarchaeia archaeon]